MPAEPITQYVRRITTVTALDLSGEFCDTCQTEDTYVQVQYFGRDRDGQPQDGACCVACLPADLDRQNIDTRELLTIEVEPATLPAIQDAL